MIIYSAAFFNDESISFMVGKFVGWLIYLPAELGVYIPEFCGQFQYDISYIAGSYFSSNLVFDMYEMSIMLNADNSISGSPFQVPFARLPVLEIYMISYLEGWFVSGHCLLNSFKSVLI